MLTCYIIATYEIILLCSSMILLPIIKFHNIIKICFRCHIQEACEHKIRFLSKRTSRHFRAAKWKKVFKTEIVSKISHDLERQFEGFMIQWQLWEGWELEIFDNWWYFSHFIQFYSQELKNLLILIHVPLKYHQDNSHYNKIILKISQNSSSRFKSPTSRKLDFQRF